MITIVVPQPLIRGGGLNFQKVWGTSRTKSYHDTLEVCNCRSGTQLLFLVVLRWRKHSGGACFLSTSRGPVLPMATFLLTLFSLAADHCFDNMTWQSCRCLPLKRAEKGLPLLEYHNIPDWEPLGCFIPNCLEKSGTVITTTITQLQSQSDRHQTYLSSFSLRDIFLLSASESLRVTSLETASSLFWATLKRRTFTFHVQFFNKVSSQAVVKFHKI